MDNRRLAIGAVLILAFVSGCTTVRTSVTTFYLPEYKSSETISVIAADAGLNDSLEFAHYKKLFEEKLAAAGYAVVDHPSEARYLALVAYGIDSGKSSIVSTPIFGPTGGGTTYSSGTVYGPGGSA